MAASIKYPLWFCLFATASWIGLVSSSSSSSLSIPTCLPVSNTVIYDLLLQCPPSISPSSPIEMDGDSLDRAFSSSPMNVYTAVLFYASWCPFSSDIWPKFNALSSMFPQITHLAVEHSSAMPSVFSRYGIHGVPTILIVNQTIRVQYHSRKNLQSLVHFYKKTTGLEPVGDLCENLSNLSDNGKEVSLPLNGSSVKEIILKEPYLGLSVLFLWLRAFLYFFPQVLSRLAALWVSNVPHLNLGIFGEASQLLGRILHLIDVKGVWSKLKLCKTRKFHEQARSARVLASSLASVSLGETSLARTSLPGDL